MRLRLSTAAEQCRYAGIVENGILTKLVGAARGFIGLRGCGGKCVLPRSVLLTSPLGCRKLRKTWVRSSPAAARGYWSSWMRRGSRGSSMRRLESRAGRFRHDAHPRVSTMVQDNLPLPPSPLGTPCTFLPGCEPGCNHSDSKGQKPLQVRPALASFGMSRAQHPRGDRGALLGRRRNGLSTAAAVVGGLGAAGVVHRAKVMADRLPL